MAVDPFILLSVRVRGRERMQHRCSTNCQHGTTLLKCNLRRGNNYASNYQTTLPSPPSAPAETSLLLISITFSFQARLQRSDCASTFSQKRRKPLRCLWQGGSVAKVTPTGVGAGRWQLNPVQRKPCSFTAILPSCQLR